MAMKPPIIVNDNAQIDASGDLRMYDSIALADQSLESYDASDDQMRAFDSEGVPLKIVADPDGGAHLEPAEASLRHRDTLLKILRHYFAKQGEHGVAAEERTLESLIKAARDRNLIPTRAGEKSNLRMPYCVHLGNYL
jgi:hypothetical protein